MPAASGGEPSLHQAPGDAPGPTPTESRVAASLHPASPQSSRHPASPGPQSSRAAQQRRPPALPSPLPDRNPLHRVALAGPLPGHHPGLPASYTVHSTGSEIGRPSSLAANLPLLLISPFPRLVASSHARAAQCCIAFVLSMLTTADYPRLPPTTPQHLVGHAAIGRLPALLSCINHPGIPPGTASSSPISTGSSVRPCPIAPIYPSVSSRHCLFHLVSRVRLLLKADHLRHCLHEHVSGAARIIDMMSLLHHATSNLRL